MTDEARELVRLVWEQAEPRAAAGDTGYAAELGTLLAARYEAAQAQSGEYRHGLARVVRILALTPGRDGLEQLVRLLDGHVRHGSGETGPRHVASLLAGAHDPAELARVLYGRPGPDGLDELRACLFHELLLRGVDVQASKELEPLAHWRRNRRPYSPLAWLPDERRPFEAGSTFRVHSVNGSAYGPPSGLPAEGRLDPPTPRTTEPARMRDVATKDVHETIVAAPEQGEFGNCDAWVFEPDTPLDPAEVPALLPALPMACVSDLTPTSRFALARRPLEDIWPMLFGTASMGGCYGGGVGGAWGRRAAWWSVAGLCGAPSGATAGEVERIALGSAWFHFESDSAWFHNEIHDYGIAALSPDGRRLAVLAATDTD
ncbi:DUF6183 family protein [Streptomyces sp. NPDC101118]|uniref:DUF6183 family protein n=1 Tax=Streptomyces sp. NPDC101118 TaxID=3366109 RepID=UPI003825FB8A